MDKEFAELTTPSFTVVDLDFSYHVSPKAKVYLTVDNLFDSAYSEHLSRTLSMDKLSRIKSPGRNFDLGFSFSL